jgi:hypothetical protein
MVEQSPIVTPEGGKIITQKDIDEEAKNNPLLQADFMQP